MTKPRSATFDAPFTRVVRDFDARIAHYAPRARALAIGGAAFPGQDLSPAALVDVPQPIMRLFGQLTAKQKEDIAFPIVNAFADEAFLLGIAVGQHLQLGGGR